MILYLIKSGLCLAIVLGIYHLLLEREKMPIFNRYFLLFGLGFSFVVPLITVASVVASQPEVEANPLLEVASQLEVEANFSLVEVASQLEVEANLSFLITMLYIIIAGIFLIRFSYRLTTIFRKAFLHEKVSYQSAKLVLIKEKVLPHTFWNFIFVNEADYQQQDIEAELFTHELTHVVQRHSFDILLIEALQVLFWFNPFLIPYKRAIQLNHEYLADDQVVRSHRQVREYQHLLLDKVASSKIYLASNLNYLVTKKRLAMMTKNTSPRRAFLFASSTIPLFVCLLMIFGMKAIAQESSANNTKTVEKQEIKDTFFKDALFNFEGKSETGYKLYKDLTNLEKKALPPLPPLTPFQSKLTPLTKGTIVHVSGNKISLLGNINEVPPPPPPSAPKAPKAPKTSKVKKESKAPKMVKNPKQPKAPKAVKESKEPKAVKAPKEPKAPNPAMAPPPPPPAPEVHLEQLAQAGATFMKDGKEISAEEAIRLVSDNDSVKSIQVKKGDGSGTTVYIKMKKARAY